MHAKQFPTHKKLAQIRLKSLEMAHTAGGGHLGAAYSITEILTVLYHNILRVKPHQPQWPDRDRFILSKGHGCLALYVILAEMGFFPKKQLELYCQPGGILPGHTTLTVPGVEASTGSLGHGLSIGVGMALAAKLDKKPWRVFVVLSDGDCQEGSTWEAILAAGHHKLDNLVVIVDFNNLNSFEKVTNMFHNFEPLANKFKDFGWAVKETDGHNVDQIYESLSASPFNTGKPSIVIAHTVKGKGVSFMENSPVWHYRAPTQEEYQKAMKELSQI
ncbi:transketolase [Candidatus Daviesbacteria bacterium]|nr:transketolase [Candidatus Daviesbacteria bacterium]